MTPSASSELAGRVNTSVLAGAEKRLLTWIAERLPQTVNSDHLTVLGGLAMLGVGVCFWAGAHSRPAIAGVVPLLALNWFGDSLDGTLARVRRVERPRYGYYVDHVLDAIGFAALVAGLDSRSAHVARHRPRVSVRLLPARHRGGALGARARRLPPVVLAHRTDGAADPPRGWRARALAVADGDALRIDAGCYSTWVVSAESLVWC